MTSNSEIPEGLEVFQYTDNSFIVFGHNSKLYKDDLKALKGTFSVNLKKFQYPCWLYSMARLDSVKHYINSGEVIVAELPDYVQPDLVHNLRSL
jgi:hypothetical protein